METNDQTSTGDVVVEYGPATQLRGLKEALGDGVLSCGPDRLAVSQIEVMLDLFQPRAESEKHISDLKRAIQNFGELEPMKVMQIGKSGLPP